MAEDICPNWGCYGDRNAKTPFIDAFARENIRFNYCYSAAPVCSAARSSLNLGMYGSAAGVGQHRSMNRLPGNIKNIGYYMQQAGYYTAIGKTDFNFQLTEGYDVMMGYDFDDTPDFAAKIIRTVENAPKEKPVFIIQTSAITHQSQYGYTQDKEEHRKRMPRLKKKEWQDRSRMYVPRYHFDSEEAREICAQYHEKMTSLDRMLGETIEALKKSGRYGNSIILIVGDNGHGIPEGKINLWDEGVHVPLLLHIPRNMEKQLTLQKDKSGRYSNRYVTFVDFAPTFLSIANEEIPSQMQGNAFLGEKRTTDPKMAFSFGERCDEVFENSRSIHADNKMYSCDFGLTPYKRLNTYQITQAPWFVKSMIIKGYENKISDYDRRALFRQIPRVDEQFYDLEVDRSQLNNLVENEINKTELLKFREKMFTEIEKYRDGALLPEPLARELESNTGKCIYEILRDDNLYPLRNLILLWKKALDGEDLSLIAKEKGLHPAAKLMLLKYAMKDKRLKNRVKDYIEDESETVRAYASFVLKDVEVLKKICETSNNFVLLMFIVDLIAVWREKETKECFEILVNRFFQKKDLAADERFTAGMYSGLHMLGVRLNEKMRGIPDNDMWTADKMRNSFLVMETLDRKG